MSLQAQLDAFKAEFLPKRPQHVQDTMARTTAALQASGQAGRALKAGDTAPALQAALPATLPMPGRYVIARDGVIAYAEVDADDTRRPEPSELLPILQRLAQPRPC